MQLSQFSVSIDNYSVIDDFSYGGTLPKSLIKILMGLNYIIHLIFNSKLPLSQQITQNIEEMEYLQFYRKSIKLHSLFDFHSKSRKNVSQIMALMYLCSLTNLQSQNLYFLQLTCLIHNQKNYSNMQPNFNNTNLTHLHPTLNYQPRSIQTPQAFLTPQKLNQNVQNFPNFHHQQTERIMYKSTIQPVCNTHNQTFSGSFGLGKLESMGRAIHQIDEQPNKNVQKTTVIQLIAPKPLAFRQDRSQKSKMASSMIFFNNKAMQPTTNFPSSTNVPLPKNEASKGIQSLISKAKVVSQERDLSQTLQNRRNQQIFEIKQQMDQLSHKIESCRPKNAPAFLPPKPPQQACNLKFVNSNHNGQNPMNATSSSSNLKVGNNQENNYKITVNFNQTQTLSNTVKQVDNQQFDNDLLKRMSNLSTSTTASSQSQKLSIKQETTMFKKKSPFKGFQSQKTDQNLLKMLGINLKSPISKQLNGFSLKQENLYSKTTIQTTKIYTSQVPNKIIQKNINTRMNHETTIPRKFTKDDFKIGKKMGKGQFGQVMLVQHKLTGFICGMKVMSKKQIKSQKYQNQIARQLSIQFYLSHRNVAPLYGYFQDSENIYLLVEFCTDGQLLDKIRKNRRMEQDQVSPIIRQICEGLDYIHKEEIIHRDIKPENILFNFGTVKISDFGWAVHCGNGTRKTVSGSPLYYSPEIVLQTQYDQKIDIWSIGMMAYQCLLGKIPFRIYSQFDLNRIVEDEIKFPEYVDVTDEAKDFILGIMKKKPEERMEMKQIMRHPFILKYLKQRKVAPQVLQEFKKILTL